MSKSILVLLQTETNTRARVNPGILDGGGCVVMTGSFLADLNREMLKHYSQWEQSFWPSHPVHTSDNEHPLGRQFMELGLKTKDLNLQDLE